MIGMCMRVRLSDLSEAAPALHAFPRGYYCDAPVSQFSLNFLNDVALRHCPVWRYADSTTTQSSTAVVAPDLTGLVLSHLFSFLCLPLLTCHAQPDVAGGTPLALYVIGRRETRRDTRTSVETISKVAIPQDVLPLSFTPSFFFLSFFFLFALGQSAT